MNGARLSLVIDTKRRHRNALPCLHGIEAQMSAAKTSRQKLEANVRSSRNLKSSPIRKPQPGPAVLRYLTDHKPGIARKRHGKSFRYTHPDGTAVKDEETLGRIKSLVIPPAWQDVWIAPIANGHLQATGRDARGRKQGRAIIRTGVRCATKPSTAASRCLPPCCRSSASASGMIWRCTGCPRTRCLATIVSVMESTFIRVGNAEYAKQNESYGLTTMRQQHVDIHGSHIHFTFKGKSGVHHEIDLADRRLAHIISSARTFPAMSCFSLSITTEIIITWTQPTSTSTCARSPMSTSPQGLSHLGRHRAGLHDAAAAGAVRHRQAGKEKYCR